VESVKEKMGHIGIFTVINDWAKLRGMPDADEIRENYWGDPQYELLEAIDVSIYQPHILNGIGFGGIVKRGRFSEKALQNRFSRLFPRKREACDGPSCEYSFNKCSSEVVMIARELYTVGIRRLVSLMPNICKNPISYASHSLARGEFTLSDGILSEGFTMETFYMTCFQTETIQDVLSNHEKERISIPPSL
jgi:hypothetical protein